MKAGTASGCSLGFGGGQTITLNAPLERLPLLMCAGVGQPLSSRLAYADSAQDQSRELKLSPQRGYGQSEGLVFEDDSVSYGWQRDNALWLNG